MLSLSFFLVLLGGLMLVLNPVSRKLKKYPFSETMLAFLFGVLIGPQALDWVNLETMGNSNTILLLSSRLTLGIALMGVALHIPQGYVRQHFWSIHFFVLGVMTAMWVLTSLLVSWILGLPLWLAILVGAIVTPTDPVAASPIVNGPLAEKKLPAGLRNAIQYESGVNDGLAYLFVYLPILVLTQSLQEALRDWSVRVFLWEVVAALLFGFLCGYLSAKIFNYSLARRYMKKDSKLSYTVALSLFVLGGARLFGSDEILSVFAAGLIFSNTIKKSDKIQEKLGQESINRFFSVPIFALLGTAIPWTVWYEMGGAVLLTAAAIVLFRRIPALLLLKPLLPTIIPTSKDALFLGWFGPIAIGAMYYAALAQTHIEDQRIWGVVSLTICLSIFIHGFTASPFTKVYGRNRE